jgi:uncharacterized protein (TIGR00369 family)
LTKDRPSNEIENRGVDPDIFAFICAIQDQSPIFVTLGFRFLYLGPGEAALGICPAPGLSSYAGRVNGGILAALADNVMGMAGLTLGTNVRTVDISLNYFRPVFEHRQLSARGYIINSGRTLMVAEAELFDQEQLLVAKSRGTFIRGEKIPFW